MKRVCVYAASSSKVKDSYYKAALLLGEVLAANNITTVYGGGSIGLMGALAEGVLQNNGKIIGIIPEFMMELEWGNRKVELVVVQDMPQRKQKFLENVDAVIALPGGTGTLEELAEVLSMKKLALFTKPIIIINTDGFYNQLIAFLERMVSDSFMRPEHMQVFTVIDTPDQLLEAFQNAPAWSKDAIEIAGL